MSRPFQESLRLSRPVQGLWWLFISSSSEGCSSKGRPAAPSVWWWHGGDNYSTGTGTGGAAAAGCHPLLIRRWKNVKSVFAVSAVCLCVPRCFVGCCFSIHVFSRSYSVVFKLFELKTHWRHTCNQTCAKKPLQSLKPCSFSLHWATRWIHQCAACGSSMTPAGFYLSVFSKDVTAVLA